VLVAEKPGITNFASIVFSGVGDIMKEWADPDIAYSRVTRLGEGMTGLCDTQPRSLLLDMQLCLLTVLAIFSRRRALVALQSLPSMTSAPSEPVHLASQSKPLVPMLPPGSDLW
jgi:hypothetical protein